MTRRSRSWLLGIILIVCLMLAAAAKGGGFLVLDSPQPSDTILVLAGETEKRPERALQLLEQGYAKKIVLDVPEEVKIYEFTQLQLAEKYIRDSPYAAVISVCPIKGLSTLEESQDAEKCLAAQGARSVLIVTSDFHTRRALSIFRKAVPTYEYSTAAALDVAQFGVRWWHHRQWAKTFLNEGMRLIWWNLIDRWR